MSSERIQENRSGSYTAASILLIFLWLVHLVPFLAPQARLWGINHLIFLPDYWLVVYLMAGGLVFVLLTVGRRFSQRMNDFAARLLFDGSYRWRWVIISIIAVAVFWLLRMPTNLLGDGYAMINDVGNDLPVIFKWTEAGAIRLVYGVYSLLPAKGLEGARTAYAVVSVLSGGVTLLLMAGIANELVEDFRQRFWTFCLLVCSGWLLLFFGYAENYPIIWPFVTGYVYTALKYMKGNGGLVVPTILLLAAVTMHLQALFFICSYPMMFIDRGKMRSIGKKYRRALIFSSLVLALTAFIIFMMEYNRSVEFRVHFLPPFIGRPATPDYAMFSFKHLADIINEFSLLIPLWPLMLFLGWPYIFRGKDEPAAGIRVKWFLMAFSIGGLVFLFILDPKLGMGRDWDLYALAGLGPMLFLIRSLSKVKRDLRQLYPSMVVLAFVLVLPFLAVNLSYNPSLKYISWLLDREYPRTESGMVGLLNYYRDSGNDIAADSLNHRIREVYPRGAAEGRAMELAQSGRYDRALSVADSLYRSDPYSSKPYNIRGLVHFYQGEFERAAENFEQAVRLVPESYRVLVNLALAYHRQGRLDEMMGILRRARRLAPEFDKMYEAFAVGFFTEGRYDSSLVYAGHLIRVDPENEGGYLMAGVSCFRLGDYDRAEKYLNQYLAIEPKGPEKVEAVQLLEVIEESKK